MLFLYLCCFFLSDKTVIGDSTIFKVDISNLEALEITLSGKIVDYVIDDHIYALTDRYLFKIDLNSLRTLDRIPLPQRFNYVTIGSKEIVLIAAGEIIMVDKKNFSFLSGIGIEAGDYRPIIAPKLLTPAGKGNLAYLLTDDGEKSHLKVFDMKTGKLVKRLNTAMITSCRYDPDKKILMCSDIDNRLIFRDLNLKKKKQVKFNVACADFKRSQYGYFIRNLQGIFAVDTLGKTVDFQPMYACRQSDFYNFLFVADNYLVFLDTLTLRIRSALPNINGINDVMLLDDLTTIGRNARHDLYLIDNNRLIIERLAVKEMQLEQPPITTPVLAADSLWHIQFAAFSKPEYATAFCDSIATTGLPVFIDTSGVYRIELGGFKDKMTALEILEALDVPGWIILNRVRTSAVGKEFIAGGKKYLLHEGIIRKE